MQTARTGRYLKPYILPVGYNKWILPVLISKLSTYLLSICQLNKIIVSGGLFTAAGNYFPKVHMSAGILVHALRNVDELNEV